jgi:hypothetical protein
MRVEAQKWLRRAAEFLHISHSVQPAGDLENEPHDIVEPRDIVVPGTSQLDKGAVIQHVQGWQQAAQVRVTDDKILNINGRIPGYEELRSICEGYANDPNMVNGYIWDGCYARAHVMAKDLMDRGINVSKAFIFGSGEYTLHSQNSWIAVNWGYHVAPLVFAHDPYTNEIEPFILDPGLAPRPLRPAEWIDCLGDKKARIELMRVAQYQPPTEGQDLQRDEDFESLMPISLRTLKHYETKFAQIVANPEKVGDILREDDAIYKQPPAQAA